MQTKIYNATNLLETRYKIYLKTAGQEIVNIFTGKSFIAILLRFINVKLQNSSSI